jgi:hypothetical protein
MPSSRTITIYQFDELSNEAKEKARDWWRRAGFASPRPRLESWLRR